VTGEEDVATSSAISGSVSGGVSVSPAMSSRSSMSGEVRPAGLRARRAARMRDTGPSISARSGAWPP
jgi:hypothetical protein